MGLTAGTYSGIKSVQRGTINIPAGSTSANQAITAVNMAKAEVRFLGCTANQASTDYTAYVALTSGTNVQATRSNSSIVSTFVGFEVTEWY